MANRPTVTEAEVNSHETNNMTPDTGSSERQAPQTPELTVPNGTRAPNPTPMDTPEHHRRRGINADENVVHHSNEVINSDDGPSTDGMALASGRPGLVIMGPLPYRESHLNGGSSSNVVPLSVQPARPQHVNLTSVNGIARVMSEHNIRNPSAATNGAVYHNPESDESDKDGSNESDDRNHGAHSAQSGTHIVNEINLDGQPGSDGTTNRPTGLSFLFPKHRQPPTVFSGASMRSIKGPLRSGEEIASGSNLYQATGKEIRVLVLPVHGRTSDLESRAIVNTNDDSPFIEEPDFRQDFGLAFPFRQSEKFVIEDHGDLNGSYYMFFSTSFLHDTVPSPWKRDARGVVFIVKMCDAVEVQRGPGETAVYEDMPENGHNVTTILVDMRRRFPW